MKWWPLALLAWTLVVSQPSHHFQPSNHRERNRIQAHLAHVESDLRAIDVSALSSERRAARATHLDRLREYRLRGEFPHNHDLPNRTPCFVDRHGTPCAMAYLIASSGGGALVDRVRRDANLARIRDLEDDAELVAWLDRAGMTAKEAARVQPQYGPREDPRCECRGLSRGATAAMVMLGLAGTAANLGPPDDDRSLGRVFGRLAGVAGMFTGGHLLANDAENSAPQAITILAGGLLSFVAAVRPVPASPRPTTETARSEWSSEPQTPTLTAGVRIDRDGRPQIAASVRF